MNHRKKYKKVQHKNIKNNKVLLSVLQKQKNIPKGTLLLVKEKILSYFIEGTVDKDGVLTKINKNFGPKLLEPGKMVLFLDIIWEPTTQRHYFRFLSGDKIVGLEYRQRETFARISKTFDIVSPGSYDIDKDKEKFKSSKENVQD